MASPPKNILVIGATGVIGRFLIGELIASKQSFGRLAIATSQNTIERKSAGINTLKGQGVEVIVADITNTGDIQRAYEGIDTVISAVGRPIIDAQIKLLEIAEATSHVKYFYPSEYGTDIEYGPKSKEERPHQLKLLVRKYIQEHIKRLQYTYLVTGPYADSYIGSTRNEKAGSFDVVKKHATLLGTGNERISLTTMRE
jgi:nucleoside-diphosphate-sugar epimerase